MAQRAFLESWEVPTSLLMTHAMMMTWRHDDVGLITVCYTASLLDHRRF